MRVFFFFFCCCCLLTLISAIDRRHFGVKLRLSADIAPGHRVVSDSFHIISRVSKTPSPQLVQFSQVGCSKVFVVARLFRVPKPIDEPSFERIHAAWCAHFDRKLYGGLCWHVVTMPTQPPHSLVLGVAGFQSQGHAEAAQVEMSTDLTNEMTSAGAGHFAAFTSW